MDDNTALLWAADNGHTDCVRLLLEAGVDKQKANEEGSTASVCLRRRHTSTTLTAVCCSGGANKDKQLRMAGLRFC